MPVSGREPGSLGSRFGLVGSVVSGTGLREGSMFGSRDGSRDRSCSRRRRRISLADGKPSTPVFELVPEVGVESSPGNVGAVVPVGGARKTPIVGSCGVISFDCSRAILSVAARVSYRIG